MSLLGSIGGSILRGGLIKGLGRKLVKGLSRGAGKIAKGIKRGAIKASRGFKRLGAQIKSLPDSFTRAKAAAFPKKPQVMGITKKGKVMITKAPVGRTTSEKVETFFKQFSRWQTRSGKRALSKDSAERLAGPLGKLMARKQQKSALNNLVKNARAGETWGAWASRNASKLAGKSKDLVNNIIKEGGSNIVVDQSVKYAGRAGLGLGTAAVSGAVTAGIVEGKK
tara:strand:+ start:709 stop:1380 length:672 start_codon:yes stop_codon:yes gene_type:complete